MKKVIIYGLGVSGQAMYELLGDECEILLLSLIHISEPTRPY